MDIDLSQSEMSRFTTMLAKAGAPFDRVYGPSGLRIIEVYGVAFSFGQEGDIVDVLPPEDDE